MGQVFRARDTKLDRAFAHDADRLARFTREAKTPHAAGIVHRDLKPNILITQYGQVDTDRRYVAPLSISDQRMDGIAESFEVPEVAMQHADHQRRVDASVIVNQDVAESHHRRQRGTERRGQQSCLGQNVKGIGTGLGHPQPAVGHDVIGHIHARLDGQMQRPLDNPLNFPVCPVVRHLDPAIGSELFEIGIEQREPPKHEVAVNHAQGALPGCDAPGCGSRETCEA